MRLHHCPAETDTCSFHYLATLRLVVMKQFVSVVFFFSLFRRMFTLTCLSEHTCSFPGNS